MIEFIKNWVLNIAVVVVVLLLAEILIPSGRIKKILNVITGFIIIITVIHPFIKLFLNDYDLSLLDELERNFDSAAGISTIDTGFREEQLKQIARVYREKLIEGIEQLAIELDEIRDAKADIIINEDYNSGYFGEIKKLYLCLWIEKDSIKAEGKQEDKSFRITPPEEIKKVRISMGKDGEAGQESAGRGIGGEKSIDGITEDKTSGLAEVKSGDELIKNRIEKTLENKLSIFLSIKEEDIVITYR